MRGAETEATGGAGGGAPQYKLQVQEERLVATHVASLYVEAGREFLTIKSVWSRAAAQYFEEHAALRAKAGAGTAEGGAGGE